MGTQQQRFEADDRRVTRRQMRDRLDAGEALDRDRRHDPAHAGAGARVVVDVDDVDALALPQRGGRLEQAALLPPSGGSSCTEMTNSPSRSMRWSSVSRARPPAQPAGRAPAPRNGRPGGGSRRPPGRIAATWAGVVPQQPPISRAPSSRAWAANSPKYSGVACGKTIRGPEMLARPTFGSAASARRRRPSRERRAARRRARHRGSRRSPPGRAPPAARPRPRP